ncbi:J domain-containing protein [Labilibacter marinus]|uniref:J domain-containing protein n=1 Tax=Labilibacter marinus TaxID=1477105 RepID=UPI0009502E2F|nr:J domain-containing protein [Labilibacter marinus]
MNHYHQILGITANASLDQIKSAYRKKAKLLHPDINKADNAQEQFILLNEAYEYLLNTAGSHTNQFKRAQEQAKRQAAYQAQWEQQEKAKTRVRAQAYARMKYEAYIKSDIYKTTEAINMVVDFMVTCLILLFVIGLPVLSYQVHGPFALIFCAIIILPTSPLWFRFLVSMFGNLRLKSLIKNRKATLRSKMTVLVGATFLNLLVLFKIAFCTLIEIHISFSLYILAISIAVLLTNANKGKFKKYMYRYNLAPGIISLLFAINYYLSFNPSSETYIYSYKYNSSPIFVSIQLNNNAYFHHKGIRTFMSKESIIGYKYIKYTFAEGAMGYKVARAREFMYELPQ